MFGKKTNTAPTPEEQAKIRMTPELWTRREQENDGQWDSYFMNLTAELEAYPTSTPPMGSVERSGAEDASILQNYWIGYWSGIVNNYDTAIRKIDTAAQTVVDDRRMSQKSKALCLAAARKHRGVLLERKQTFDAKLAKAVQEGREHLAKAVSPHHRALESTLANFPDKPKE